MVRPQKSSSGRGSRAKQGARGGGAGKTSGKASGNARGTRGAARNAGARGGGAKGGTRRASVSSVRDTRESPRKSVAKGLGGEQVEGRQAVRELLLSGKRKTREIWIASDLDENDVVNDIVEIAHQVRVQVMEVNRKRLEQQARSEAPQGIIAFAAPLPEAEFDQMLRDAKTKKSFLVAVDGVTDPGNLGALLRCCDGAGVDGVILPRHRAVHVTPTVAKSAAGAIEYMPMALVGGLPTAIKQMRDAGIWVVGLDDAADRSLFELGDLASDPICIVLGAEGAGLSRLVRERCDMVVSIPMLGRLSSLNVSVAGALAVYEVARSRR